MSNTERLTKLNLLPLEFRREISDLLLFFKSINTCVLLSLAIKHGVTILITTT